VAHDKGRPLHTGNDVRHREGLAAAGDTQQRLFIEALLQTVYQFIDCLGLVAGHIKIRY